jgi:hypothetical protein
MLRPCALLAPTGRLSLKSLSGHAIFSNASLVQLTMMMIPQPLANVATSLEAMYLLDPVEVVNCLAVRPDRLTMMRAQRQLAFRAEVVFTFHRARTAHAMLLLACRERLIRIATRVQSVSRALTLAIMFLPRRREIVLSTNALLAQLISTHRPILRASRASTRELMYLLALSWSATNTTVRLE